MLTTDLKTPVIRHSNVNIQYNVPATMRDGVTLFADVYRPEVDHDLPVLLMRTPYDKSFAQTSVYLDPSWYARYGYMVVVQDCRGRFASEGNWSPYDAEVSDGYDAVEWAADLDGSNGSVVMYGFSYPGIVQLQAASGRPRGLKAIVPSMTASDFFDGWTYEGGALSQAFLQSWVLFLAQDTARRVGDFDTQKALWQTMMGLPGTYWITPIANAIPASEKYAPYYSEWLEHETYDDYWKKKSVRELYEYITVPALHIGGWYDIFASGTIRNYVELNKRALEDPSRGRQKLLIGPWHHLPWQQQVGSCDFGAEAKNIVNTIQLKWLDQQLGLGRETNEEDPKVSVFVLGLSEWKNLSDWPPTNATEVKLFLHSGGRANSLSGDGSLSKVQPAEQPWDSFIHDPSSPVISTGGHSCCFDQIAPMGPTDQRRNEMRNDVLVYTSDELTEDVTVMGLITLTLYAASTAVDTDFALVVSDVAECGRAINIVNSIIRASRRESLVHPSYLEPGKVYEYKIDVGWTAALFKAGHRIRLDVSSSNFPHFGRTPNSKVAPSTVDLNDWAVARQTIFHDSQYPSCLVLPVV